MCCCIIRDYEYRFLVVGNLNLLTWVSDMSKGLRIVAKRTILLCFFVVLVIAVIPSVSAQDTEPIKVGVLHSLSGTMSISETTVRDSTLMAIDEINAAGGVLGRQIVPIVEDGASDWPTFAEKARKLLLEDGVSVIFGDWTSASRKAMLPVVEENDGLLFYPVQYEGLEESPTCTTSEPMRHTMR